MNPSTGSTGNTEMGSTLHLRQCRFCGGTSLRRSRLRFSDLPRVLVLRWPVRCRRCSKRQYFFLTEARRVIASSPPHVSQPRQEETWQTFTAGDSPALRDNEHINQHGGQRSGEGER